MISIVQNFHKSRRNIYKESRWQGSRETERDEGKRGRKVRREREK